MVASHPYVCVIDADSLLEEDALLKVAKPILDDPDLVVATGGTIRVANGCRVDHGRVVDIRLPKSGLATIQVIEYLRAFLVARVGWSRHNALGIISGAFGLFDRNILETVGGYWTDTVGEDFELTLRLHRYLRDRDEPYRIVFVPDPVCWTEVPEQFSTLSRQRRRWQRGLWQGLRRHQHDDAQSSATAPIGMVSMPHFALFEFLSPVFALGGSRHHDRAGVAQRARRELRRSRTRSSPSVSVCCSRSPRSWSRSSDSTATGARREIFRLLATRSSRASASTSSTTSGGRSDTWTSLVERRAGAPSNAADLPRPPSESPPTAATHRDGHSPLHLRCTLTYRADGVHEPTTPRNAAPNDSLKQRAIASPHRTRRKRRTGDRHRCQPTRGLRGTRPGRRSGLASTVSA